MTRGEPSPDESTAYHEAGHALVGHILGFVIDGITIVGKKDLGGYALIRRRPAFPGIVDFDPAQRPPGDISLADRLTYLYAGVVAQRLLCAQRGVSSEPVRPGDDIYVARSSVQHLPKEEQIELLDSAEKRAMELLSDPQNWQMLESIAAKLLECRSLDGSSLLELLLR